MPTRRAISAAAATNMPPNGMTTFTMPLHVLATGETDGYYADYAGEPVRLLGRCLAEGFAYQGEASPIAAMQCAARQARICRRKPSSPSCNATTRWATALSASALRILRRRHAARAAAAVYLLAPGHSHAVHG